MRFIKRSVIYIIPLLLIGCGASTDEKRSEAILSANIALTKGDCSSAISILESAGRVDNDAKYIITLASAYACKSGFREPTFFDVDLPLSASPSPIGGLARYGTSSGMSSPIHVDFTSTQTAIDLLLYAGGLSTSVSPTATARANKFTADEASDINTFLLYLIMTQLGRYYYYYGDSSSTGVKGSGSGTNGCFANYENVALDVGTDLDTYLGLGVTGSCTAAATGHADLGTVGSLNISRMCQGVVLLNTLIEILPLIIADSTSDDFTVISSLQTTFTTLKTAINTAKSGMTNILNVTSQSLCETQNASNDDYIQVYFAFMFEKLFL